MDKGIIGMIEEQNIKVVSINKENNTFSCDNGIEYPLDGLDIDDVNELQKHIDKAKSIIKEIVLDNE